jgi:D-proline reductase (dithiol) PrdB
MHVNYMESIRKRYENLGYQPYRWFMPEEASTWSKPRKPLSESKVGLLSTSGAYALGQIAYHYKDDASTREIPIGTSIGELRFSHITENYLVSPRKDPNCILPIDTLKSLSRKGVIGSLADTVISCMGGTYSQRKVREEIAPRVLEKFIRDDIDCALLVAM